MYLQDINSVYTQFWFWFEILPMIQRKPIWLRILTNTPSFRKSANKLPLPAYTSEQNILVNLASPRQTGEGQWSAACQTFNAFNSQNTGSGTKALLTLGFRFLCLSYGVYNVLFHELRITHNCPVGYFFKCRDPFWTRCNSLTSVNIWETIWHVPSFSWESLPPHCDPSTQ